MQGAFPFRNFNQYSPTLNRHKNNPKISEETNLKRIVDDKAVVVFARKDCCLNLVLQRLLPDGLGANLVVYEVEENDVNDVVKELENVGGVLKEGVRVQLQLPTVFIDGRWFGGLDRILVAHMSGELTPLLKQVGALWTLSS